ncbi:MAG: nicotinate (nicotinamide) nucleotide adenylyltransferase [Planctomycetes bacterium]|nr:nicotinate (nicotinamide) nucleotide adenylyltransferase [Planctomycetota bacterium]
MRGMQRLGIFGGTFDPVHNGHLVLAQEALRHARLERMLLVPNAQPSHKRDRADILAASLRLQLLELAFADLPKFSIDRREIERGGLSYSIDTVRELHAEHPSHELVFLIGSDSLAELHRWREVATLLELAVFLVHPRSGHTGPFPVLQQFPQARVEFLSGPIIDISSTLVRERLALGLPLRGYVPESVELALREHLDACG